MSAETVPVTNRPVVLVVEDGPDARESLLLMLELSGFHGEAAANGAEGVTLAASARPAVAVIDIGLPILDGYDVARELRRLLGSEVVLIAHSAYTSAESRERARQAGFDHFLGKPCDPCELMQLVRRSLG